MSRWRQPMRSGAASLALLLPLAALAADPPAPAPVVAEAPRPPTLPALRARREAALERIAAADAFFSGEGTLASAFPDLAGRPMLDSVVLAAERAALVRSSRLRAAERVEVAPLAPRDAARWTAARDAALDAEDDADLRRQRLLAALEAGLARAPGLAEPAVERLLGPLRAVRDAARAELDADTDAAPPVEALTRAEAAAAAEQRVRDLRDACAVALVVPGDRGCAAQSEALASGLGTPGIAVDAPAEMLRAVLPLLTGPERAAVEAALRRHELAALSASAADLERRLAAARTAAPSAATAGAVDAAALEAPRPPPAPVGDVAIDAARLRVHTLTEELAAAVRAQGARGAASGGAAAVTAQANADAEAARRDADAARVRAGGSTSDREVAIREATAQVLAARAARHETASARLAALGSSLADRRASAAAALALPPLDPLRAGAIDAAYLEVREAVHASRRELELLRAERRAILDENARLDLDPALDPADEPALVLARAALDLALASRVDDADADLRATVELLQAAKEARRLVRPEASVAARSLARRTFLLELWEELREVPLVLEMHLVRARRAVAGLSGRALDVTAWWAGVWWLGEVLAVLVAWRWTRARLPAMVAGLGERWARDEEAARWLGDPRNLVPQGSRLGQRLLDAVMIGLGSLWLGPGSAWLGVALLVALGRVVVRISANAVDVLLATPEEPRPALHVVSHDDRERAKASLRLGVRWFFAEAVLVAVAQRILDSDRLAEVIDTLGAVVGVGVGLVLLSWWSKRLHQALADDPDPDPIVRWLVAHAGAPGSLRYLATAGVGAAALGANAASERLRQRGGEGRLGWFGTALERRRLSGGVVGDPHEGPDPSLQERLSRAPLAPPREGELAMLRACYARWRAEGTRGLVAVTGDAGAGRSALLSAFAGEVGVPVRTLAPPARLLDAVAVRRWLSSELTGAPVDTDAQLVDRLAALPPTVVILDDLHRLFLRTVGGYDALCAVVSAMQQTSNQHFWVTSCQAGAWAVLQGLPQRVPLQAYSAVVRMSPLGPAALRGWLVARAEAAGLRLRWEHLLGRSGVVSDLAVQRAENAWFRLLADASGGNPRLALEVFAAALRPHADDVADVVLPAVVNHGSLERASDDAHFLLAALVTHRSLDLPSLTLVLNLPADTVRATTLALASDGVVVAEAGEWSIRPRWAPAVERVLRQRHFATFEA